MPFSGVSLPAYSTRVTSRGPRGTGLDREDRLGERVHDVDGLEADVEEVRPQRRRVPARRDEGAVARAGDHGPLLLAAQWRRHVQDLVRRVPGRHRRRLADEDHRVVEPADVVERVDREERDVVELLTPVGRPEADRHDPGVEPAAVELPDLTDRVVLRAAGARRQPLARRPDERDHPRPGASACPA